MKPAIVLGMSVNGLGVLRGLGRQGVETYGIDKQDSIAFSSVYCKKRFVFPDPVVYPKECFNQFLELGKNLDDKAVLLPTSDPYVAFISKFRAELSPLFLFNIPEVTTLENILDKGKQYQVAARLGIPVPKTISLKRIGDLKEGIISYPAIIKGVDSKQWYTTFGNNGFITRCDNELLKHLKLALNKNIEAVIQEIVVELNKNIFIVSAYYSKAKELLAISCHEKIRQYPVDTGTATFRISVNNRELITLGQKLLEGMGYTGMSEIEFKYDERDHRFKLIELNPRFGKGNWIETCAGMNFPYIHYIDCIGKQITPYLTFKENIRWWDAVSDILAFCALWKRRDISIGEWIKSVIGVNCFAYYARDDLKPICKYYTFLVWHVIIRVLKLKIYCI